jgi:hypothetical protein
MVSSFTKMEHPSRSPVPLLQEKGHARGSQRWAGGQAGSLYWYTIHRALSPEYRMDGTNELRSGYVHVKRLIVELDYLQR